MIEENYESKCDNEDNDSRNYLDKHESEKDSEEDVFCNRFEISAIYTRLLEDERFINYKEIINELTLK